MGQGRSFIRQLVHWLIPARCFGCDALVAPDHVALCGQCWPKLDFLMGRYCLDCGASLAGYHDHRTHPHDPGYDQIRAAFSYGGAADPQEDLVRRLILRFKHADAPQLAGFFAPIMAAAGPDILAEATMILPMPSHPLRLWQRRYNQAALLAQAVAGHTGLSYQPGLLRRIRHTAAQEHLTARARQQNIQGAFALAAGAADKINGQILLLVDDVMTSGASVRGAAQLLKEAGAARVHLLLLARTILPGHL